MRNFEYFRSSYVVNDGQIYPWGVIRIVSYGAIREHDDTDGTSVLSQGLAMWSPKLLKYGDGNFYAQINERGRKVLIRRKATMKKVASIRFKDFKSGEVGRHDVGQDGFLYYWIDMGYKEWGVSRKRDNLEMDKRLRKAMAGEDPGYYDNSTFTLVDKKYAGQQVIAVNDSGHGKTFAVYTLQNESIPFQELCPLSFKKWGKTFEPRDHNFITDPFLMDLAAGNAIVIRPRALQSAGPFYFSLLVKKKSARADIKRPKSRKVTSSTPKKTRMAKKSRKARKERMGRKRPMTSPRPRASSKAPWI